MLKVYISVFMITALTPLCAAAESVGQKFSAGLKLGMFMVDSGAKSGFESASGYDVDIDNGFGFGLHGDYLVAPNWYVDVEYLSTSLDVNIGGGTGSVDVSSFAVYGAYRSTGDLYYVGKLGLISEDVSGDGGFSQNEAGLSFSVGGGYKLQENIFLEAEFTSVEKDIGFIGFTGRYVFK